EPVVVDPLSAGAATDRNEANSPRAALPDMSVQQTALSFHDRTVTLHFPIGQRAEIDALFGHCIGDRLTSSVPVTVAEDGEGCFSVRGSVLNARELTRGDLSTFLMEAVVHDLVAGMTSAVALHAGAVSDRNG